MSETVLPITVAREHGDRSRSAIMLTVVDTPNIPATRCRPVLTVTNGNTITAGGHTGATVTLTGTATQINAALAWRDL